MQIDIVRHDCSSRGAISLPFVLSHHHLELNKSRSAVIPNIQAGHVGSQIYSFNVYEKGGGEEIFHY